MIKPNKKYHFNMGYDRLIIPGKGIIITGKEVRETIKADIAEARRYFGTAVAHYTKIEKTIYVEITARKDPRSALWGRWTVKEY